MPPPSRIICLANALQYNARCVAGIRPDSGRWVRPVSELDDGRLTRRMRLVDGREPRLLEVLSIPLASPAAGFRASAEDHPLLPGPWTSAGAVSAESVRAFCRCDGDVLGTEECCVSVESLNHRPADERRTLELVETTRFRTYHRGRSPQGGHKWFGQAVTTGGAQLDAAITDPVLTERLEAGDRPGDRCLLTVALSAPYKPDNWTQEQSAPRWKIIAGVIELRRDADAAGPPAADRTHVQDVAPDDAPPVDEKRLLDVLRHTFGFHTLRRHQRPTVDAVLQGRDAMVVMPSGGGKSLCYQLPAALLPGVCVVVSPLIALMKDQVDGARTNGLRADFFNSSLEPRQRLDVLHRLRRGELDLLYVSPERLVMSPFRGELQRADIAFFAIDEAHCISDWGHDFRPDYLFLSQLKEEFPQTPIAAFTATATAQVREDIVRRLRLHDPHRVLASFDRPNFFYQVTPKTDVHRQILDFIRTRRGRPGIVYRTTRKDVESTAAMLQKHAVKARAYHAGLDPDRRQQHQEEFINDQVEVVVATIAFGMGINKPDVCYVVHGDLPKNLESYYQETGRAGRNGEPAHCLLLFSEGDAFKIRYFIDQIEDGEHRRRELSKLDSMLRFARTYSCRRQRLLAYFGETYGADGCDCCDVCTGEFESTDATRQARIVMSAVARTRERFGVRNIVDIITGADTRAIRSNRLNRIRTYGAGAGHTKEYWRGIIDALLAQGCLQQSGDRYPRLLLTDRGHDVLFGRADFQTVERRSPQPKPGPARVPREPFEPQPDAGPEPDPAATRELFEILRALRLRIARDERMPSFTVFHDRTLQDMARRRPATRQDMLRITGVGDAKWQRYGEQFLRAIGEFEQNNEG